MALIKLTAFLDNISGKVNGSVFARNKGGHYVRSKSNPTNPRTQKQSAVRAAFSSIASQWRELSESMRKAWDGAAANFPYQNKLGDTKILSGFGLFMKLSQNKLLAGQSFEYAGPPQPQGVLQPQAAHAQLFEAEDGDPLEMTITAVYSGEQVNQTLLIYATPVISAGISNFTSRLRLVGATALATNTGAPQHTDFGNAYGNVFGRPVAGDHIGIGIRVVNNSTGEASPMMQFKGIFLGA